MQILVTVIYYSDLSLELHSDCCRFNVNKNGRVIIPEQFKQGKSIVAVCEGEISILNKIGDRIVGHDQFLIENKTNSIPYNNFT